MRCAQGVEKSLGAKLLNCVCWPKSNLIANPTELVRMPGAEEVSRHVPT
jgi:hypothetical protein